MFRTQLSRTPLQRTPALYQPGPVVAVQFLTPVFRMTIVRLGTKYSSLPFPTLADAVVGTRDAALLRQKPLGVSRRELNHDRSH